MPFKSITKNEAGKGQGRSIFDCTQSQSPGSANHTHQHFPEDYNILPITSQGEMSDQKYLQTRTIGGD